MTEVELKLTHSCRFVQTTYGEAYTDTCLEFTEHSPDHWHSDHQTCVELDAAKARQIVEFLTRAFELNM